MLPITPYPITLLSYRSVFAFRLFTGTSNNYTGLSGGVQAEIWRDGSHSWFHARYSRGIPGFLGSKSFLNFFKKRVLGPIFTPQSSLKGTWRAVSTAPPHASHPKFFLKIFLPTLLPQQQASQSSHSGKRSQDSYPAPSPPKGNNFWRHKTSGDNEKAPRRTSGLQWSG